MILCFRSASKADVAVHICARTSNILVSRPRWTALSLSLSCVFGLDFCDHVLLIVTVSGIVPVLRSNLLWTRNSILNVDRNNFHFAAFRCTEFIPIYCWLVSSSACRVLCWLVTACLSCTLVLFRLVCVGLVEACVNTSVSHVVL